MRFGRIIALFLWSLISAKAYRLSPSVSRFAIRPNPAFQGARPQATEMQFRTALNRISNCHMSASRILRGAGAALPRRGQRVGLRAFSSAPSETMESIRNARLKKISDISGAGKEPFAYSFLKTHTTAELHDTYKALSPGAFDESNVTVSFAGRVMIRRIFGKLAFFEMQDEFGKIQLYIDQKRLGKDEFKSIKDWTDSGILFSCIRMSIIASDHANLSY